LALEGLFEYEGAYPNKKRQIAQVRRRGHEFLFAHRLYKSHRTGRVFDSAMTRMPFPQRWRYDFVRALDYFRACGAPRNESMGDAVELLEKKQKAEGLWLLNRGISGRKYFDLEEVGRPSRWNTLRGQRILNWWNDGDGT